MRCLDEDTVLDLVRGCLRREEISHVEQHLDECSACRRVVAQAIDGGESCNRATVAEGRAVRARSGVTPVDRADRRVAPEDAVVLSRGSAIDRFLVLDQLGAGGMGVVYAAYDPELDRKVAIKLLRWRALSEQIAHDTGVRFRREAQAMARLDHPNVIAVHDVGVHGDRVFLAMEWVDGWTLRGWLKERDRSWREILEVMKQAAEGLAAAHRAGLVHRDFKPDNVLVGKDGRVRVSDFGLARATEELDGPPSVAALDTGRALDSALTRVGTILGTPAYMPPEQRAGKTTDARADQFSFCVTLWEALYGSRPFGTRLEDAPEGFELPAPPKSDVPAWLHLVVARGLAPEPADRFSDMDALLSCLVPPAKPGRAWYATAAVAAIVLGLVVFAAYRASQADRRTCDHVEASLVGVWDEGKKRAVKSALLSTKEPWAAAVWTAVERELDRYSAEWVGLSLRTCEAARRGQTTSALEDLRRECLTRRLDELSALTRVLAEADAKVGERAVSAAQGLTPPSECEDTAALMVQVGPLLDPMRRAQVHDIRKRLVDARVGAEAGRESDAAEVAESAVAEARKVGYDPLLAEALVLHGALVADGGEPKEAVPLLREAADVAVRGRDDVTAALAYTTLATVLGSHLAQFDAAHVAGWTAQAFIDRIGTPGDLELRLQMARGAVHMMQGDDKQSEDAYQRALSLFDANADKIRRAEVLDGLGDIEFIRGDLRQAAAHYELAGSIRRAALGPDHPGNAVSFEKIAAVAWGEGRYDAAITHFHSAQRVLGPRTQGTPSALTLTANIGVVLVEQGRLEEGLEQMRSVNEKLAAAYGEGHPEVARITMQMGVAMGRLGRFREAEPLLEQALAVFRDKEGSESIDVAMVLYEQAEISRLRKRYPEAITRYERSLALVESSMGEDYRGAGHVLTGLGVVYLAQGKVEEAVPLLRRALGLREADRIGPEKRAETRFALAQALRAAGQRDEARTLAAKAKDEYAASAIANNGARQKAIETWLAAR